MQQLTFCKRIVLKFAVKVKCQKFHCRGYTEIFPKDVEEYLFQFRWKRKQPKTIRQQLEDVQNFSINDFFDYQQVKILTTEKQLSDLDNYQDLF